MPLKWGAWYVGCWSRHWFSRSLFTRPRASAMAASRVGCSPFHGRAWICPGGVMPHCRDSGWFRSTIGS